MENYFMDNVLLGCILTTLVRVTPLYLHPFSIVLQYLQHAEHSDSGLIGGLLPNINLLLIYRKKIIVSNLYKMK